jgi:hypothetical protein
MFTLEQNIFIVQCYFRNGESSYCTPRVFEVFQQKFPDFQGNYQQLALIFFSIPEKQCVQKQAWHNSRINASDY